MVELPWWGGGRIAMVVELLWWDSGKFCYGGRIAMDEEW